LGITVKGTTNPDTFHNEAKNKPPQDNEDVVALGGPSAQQAEADPPASHQHMKNDADTDDKTMHEYRERAYKAGQVLDSLTAAGDNRIPERILGRAEAIAVIPDMIKGAFGIGGRFGKGLIARRMEDGRWGAPAYISIGGGSFGAQLGVSSTDLVLVFTDRDAVNSLEKGMSLKLGVDAGVSAGPIGRSAEAGVSQNVKGGIFAYSRAKGLFAGVALDGAVLDMDKTANHKVYGENVDIDRIMTSSRLAGNPNVQPFMKSLQAAAPMKKTTR
jgi:lipid-binding SYLF domain-containing protein